MIPTADWTELLGSKRCIPMLLCLRENGPMKKTDIYSKVSRNGNMPDKIQGLERMGILTTDIRGNTTIVGLTPMGMLIADHLAEIDRLIDS